MDDTTTGLPLRKNRDFRLLWCGGLLANLGSRMWTLALPLLVLRETGSPAEAGLVGSVAGITLVAAVIPAGAVADAVERRRLMLGCELAGVAVSLTLAMSVLAGNPMLWLMLSAVAVVSVQGLVYLPAANALLRAVVPAGQVGPALSRLQAREAGAAVAGPLLGGLLFGVSPAVPFAAAAGGLLVSFSCLLAIRARSAPGRTERPLTPRHMVAGLRFVWRQRYVRTVLVVFGGGLNAAFGAVMLVALTTGARTDPSGRSSGAIVALAAVGSLVGALLAPRLRAFEHTRSAVTLCCWTAGVIVPLLAAVTAPMLIGALLAVVLCVTAVGNVAFSTELLQLTPEKLTGRVSSATNLISMASQPIGPLAGGLVADRFGHAIAFLVFGAVIVIGAVVLTASLRPHTPGSTVGGHAVGRNL
ncbi:MFS transporter [Streptomyces sioyaensis]|uniref:MFS transporter n=1 Tax=Streptomyces sioyaensis TaxID=67364 RepID=UPI0036EFA246